jgi:hypothetical protein
VKRALWAAATALVAAATAASVASAASLGGVATSALDTSAAAPSPRFALLDHFTASTATLGGSPLLLSPTGAQADLGTANAPVWTADGWTGGQHMAQAGGTGQKVAYFPFTAQNGYMATSFGTFSLRSVAGVIVTYNPATGGGTAVLVQRSGVTWTISVGAVAGGVFTPSQSATLPLTSSQRPIETELRARIQGAAVIGSYGGIDYVVGSKGPGTAAGLITYTPSQASAYDYAEAAKTP